MASLFACNLDRHILLHGPKPGAFHLLEQGASRRAQRILDQIEQVEARGPRLRIQVFSGLARKTEHLMVLIDEEMGWSISLHDAARASFDAVLL